MKSTHRAVACRGVTVALVAATLLLCASPAFGFSLTGTRDWVQSNYYKTFYLDSNNPVCTALCSLSYRHGGNVPRVVRSDPQDDAGFYSNTNTGPDDWGSGVDLLDRSNSWLLTTAFRDHFQNHAPSGTDWTRVTNHRCSVAPDQDDRWAGGHIVFYHNSVNNLPTGASTQNYFHGAVIYARHVESAFVGGLWGTCKVDRTGNADIYREPNLINLRDRQNLDYRQRHFVQVNTLVNL